MRIGSGDTTRLLQKPNMKGFKELISDFLLSEGEYPDAIKSPIHAFRAGAILEEVMYKFLPDEYMPQVRVISSRYDAMTATLDFAVLSGKGVSRFKEMKAVNFEDFLKLNHADDKLEWIKKKYRNYYNQVQYQLFVSGLSEGILMFVAVYDAANDDENRSRVIEPREVIEIEITPDDKLQSLIEERAKFFQSLKEYICQ